MQTETLEFNHNARATYTAVRHLFEMKRTKFRSVKFNDDLFIVEVVTQSMSNPVTVNGGQAVADAFMRIYGIDIKKAGALNMTYLDVEQI